VSKKKQAKVAELHLLCPGPRGWELWKHGAEGEIERVIEDGPEQLIEIGSLPGGQLAMLFPVRACQTLPMRAASTDDSLFDDLASMHAERLGVRSDPLAGQLTDTFVVRKEEEATVLLHLVLSRPLEGELPPRTPNQFDVSPRAFAVEGDAVAVWRELGRWVFAIYDQGQLIYSQASASRSEVPEVALTREIRLALGQLALQGLKLEPKRLFFWSPEGELGDPGPLEESFEGELVRARRPDPVMPSPPSELLPEDVRAARLARRHKQQRMALIGAAALLYLGFLGWIGYGLWKDYNRARKLEAEAAGVAGVAAEYQLHTARWDELGPVVTSRTPLESMLSIANSVPANSGLRLKVVDIDSEGIKVTGNAPQSPPVNAFSLALKRNAGLSWLDWENPPPNNTSKGWDFSFTGEAKP